MATTLKWREFQGGLTADCGTHRWYIMPANRQGWWKLQKAWNSPLKHFTETWVAPFQTIQEAKEVAK